MQRVFFIKHDGQTIDCLALYHNNSLQCSGMQSASTLMVLSVSWCVRLRVQDKTRILATAKKIKANAAKTEAGLQARADKAEARVTELEQQAAGGAAPAADRDVTSNVSAEAAAAAEATVAELQQQLAEAEAGLQKAKAEQEAAQVGLLAHLLDPQCTTTIFSSLWYVLLILERYFQSS